MKNFYSWFLSVALFASSCVNRSSQNSSANMSHDPDPADAVERCRNDQWLPGIPHQVFDGESTFLLHMRCADRIQLGLYGGIESRPDYYWQGGRIKFRFDSDLPEKIKRRFVEASKIWELGVNRHLAEWGVAGKIEFIEDVQKTARNFVLVVGGQEISASATGMLGGEQPLKLVEQAALRTILHELGHTLGLTHEHSRCDRDEFILVRKENIKPGKEGNFKRRCLNNEVFFPYNIQSIMHYSSDAFSINGRSTLMLREDRQRLWEQPQLPHNLDFATVARGYAEFVFLKEFPSED